ncbi:MAG: YbaY family lipoprotein [Pseudomonadota bacterium]
MRLTPRLAPICLLWGLLLTACSDGSSEPDPAEASLATLSGTVTYRERMALPINAAVNVRLLDISVMDVPVRVLAEQNIDTQGKSVPIPYQLEYDPAQVQEGLTYAVRAEIRSANGDLLWTTDTVHPVLTRDAPTDNVEIRVVRAGGRD